MIFRQSWVPQHAELHLLLSMMTPLSWLERVPTYKEQMQEMKTRDLSTYGFLGYPLLQAADILIYKAGRVPVGEDQLAHLELTREIARRFNHFYGNVFPEPQALLSKSPKVPGTDGRKMSKSYSNAVLLSDSKEEVAAKVKTMFTDPKKIKVDDKGPPRRVRCLCHAHALHAGSERHRRPLQGGRDRMRGVQGAPRRDLECGPGTDSQREGPLV